MLDVRVVLATAVLSGLAAVALADDDASLRDVHDRLPPAMKSRIDEGWSRLTDEQRAHAKVVAQDFIDRHGAAAASTAKTVSAAADGAAVALGALALLVFPLAYVLAWLIGRVRSGAAGVDAFRPVFSRSSRDACLRSWRRRLAEQEARDRR